MAQIPLISIYLPLILSLMPFPLIVPAPEEKSSQTKTKNLWFHFSGKHERQFVRFTLEKIICSFSANKL